MKSKKLLVPIDINNPDKKISGFLYPKFSNNRVILVDANDKEWNYGMVILKGGGVTENDLFSSIVTKSDEKIDSVDELLSVLNKYLEELSQFRIGNIIYAEKVEGDIGFILKKYSNRLSRKAFGEK